jgi:hypothetical protein
VAHALYQPSCRFNPPPFREYECKKRPLSSINGICAFFLQLYTHCRVVKVLFAQMPAVELPTSNRAEASANPESKPPPLVALFLIKFDLKVGYGPSTVACLCNRHAYDTSTDIQLPGSAP